MLEFLISENKLVVWKQYKCFPQKGNKFPKQKKLKLVTFFPIFIPLQRPLTCTSPGEQSLDPNSGATET